MSISVFDELRLKRIEPYIGKSGVYVEYMERGYRSWRHGRVYWGITREDGPTITLISPAHSIGDDGEPIQEDCEADIPVRDIVKIRMMV